ncbi:pectinesterase 1-like [Andrographis paniculata]|uniref:pectinesterase 1-like n=1 Tax=Andrographis paniculata TaxID=175694 RepID=UPI0021E8A612|nr:pectinesterase 1-like [Andrographis paniculata]XP_051142815.1 pectinesterase 1-like [Andrographis paniculata]
MSSSSSSSYHMALLMAVLVFLPAARSTVLIPSDKAQLAAWFAKEVGMFSTRKVALHTMVASAEKRAKIITVRADGTGQFKTLTEAINSIPTNNQNRVIVCIGPGNYTEKVKIDRLKPFVTLHGDPINMPTLIYDGTALKYGTTDSGTLIVESDYFSAVNIKVVNTAPRPDGKMKDAQAVAMDISGDYASFYNCRFHGFQDTLLDDKGRHFFKDCYIEGTVDFIFGAGQSLYLNSEIHVIPGDKMAIITAHSRSKPDEGSGYVFAHCSITGSGGTAYLGRSWFDYSRVIFAFCDMSDVVIPEGWSNNRQPETNGTVYFGEFNNRGPGAALNSRVTFCKKMTESDCNQFLSLSYIEAATWLLPPATVQLPAAR